MLFPAILLSKEVSEMNASFPTEPHGNVSYSILARPVSTRQTRSTVLMLNLTYQMALKSHSFCFSYPDKVSEG